jgi:hypothetical protein
LSLDAKCCAVKVYGAYRNFDSWPTQFFVVTGTAAATT